MTNNLVCLFEDENKNCVKWCYPPRLAKKLTLSSHVLKKKKSKQLTSSAELVDLIVRIPISISLAASDSSFLHSPADSRFSSLAVYLLCLVSPLFCPSSYSVPSTGADGVEQMSSASGERLYMHA